MDGRQGRLPSPHHRGNGRHKLWSRGYLYPLALTGRGFFPEGKKAVGKGQHVGRERLAASLNEHPRRMMMDISIKTPEVAAVDLSAALRSEKEAARNSDAAYLSWSLALATDKRRDVELVAAVKAATKNNLGFSIAASSRNRDGIVGAILSRPGDTDDFVFPESLEKRWRVPETDPHTDGPLLRDGKIVYRPLTVSWDFRASADQWSVPRVVRALLEPDNNRSVKGQTAVGKKVLLAEINACESQSQALSVIFSRYAKMVEAAKAAAKAKTEESEETSEESEKSTEETPARTLTEYLQAMAGVINAAASAEITDPAAAIVLLDGHIATLNKIREAAQAKAVMPAE